MQKDQFCMCPSENGVFKNLYTTKKEAEEMVLAQERLSGKFLRVYPCPCGEGWHLTHTKPRD